MTTTGILDIDMREVQALQRELRAVSKDFANAVQNELRAPVQRAASDFKFAARGQIPSWPSKEYGNTRSAAVREIRSTSSNRSGYAIKRESNEFTQLGYANRTGRIRHPLFGNKKYWYTTYVPGLGGWWDDMYRQAVPRATEEFTEALLKILGRLATGNLSTTTTGRRGGTTLG